MKKVKIKLLYICMDMIIYSLAALDAVKSFFKGGEM